VLGSNMLATDVVEVAIPRLSYHWKTPKQVFVRSLAALQ